MTSMAMVQGHATDKNLEARGVLSAYVFLFCTAWNTCIQIFTIHILKKKKKARYGCMCYNPNTGGQRPTDPGSSVPKHSTQNSELLLW